MTNALLSLSVTCRTWLGDACPNPQQTSNPSKCRTALHLSLSSPRDDGFGVGRCMPRGLVVGHSSAYASDAASTKLSKIDT